MRPDVVLANAYDRFVTFGSLISQYKITDKVIDSWCEILDNSPGSRLLIRNAALGKESNSQFLRTQFTCCGLAKHPGNNP